MEEETRATMEEELLDEIIHETTKEMVEIAGWEKTFVALCIQLLVMLEPVRDECIEKGDYSILNVYFEVFEKIAFEAGYDVEMFYEEGTV